MSQGAKAVLVNVDDQTIAETTQWPFDKSPRATFFAGSGRFIVGNNQAFDVQTGESHDLPGHDDCFAICGQGLWFVHLAGKFDKLIQFHRVDGSERYKIDTGTNSGHWTSFDIADYKNLMVAFEVFADSVVVLEF